MLLYTCAISERYWCRLVRAGNLWCCQLVYHLLFMQQYSLYQAWYQAEALAQLGCSGRYCLACTYATPHPGTPAALAALCAIPC